MKEAVETYRYNFIIKKGFDEKVETRDVRQQSVKEELYSYVKNIDIDVIVGGFPCQGFSMAGKRVIDDPRNSLYLDMLEIVNKIRPKVIVMENVEGILTMLRGQVVEKIISDYKNIGYNVSYKLLNSSASACEFVVD